MEEPGAEALRSLQAALEEGCARPGCSGVGRLGLGWLVGAVGGLQACCACEQGAMGPAGPRAWEGSGEGVRPGGFQSGQVAA